MDGVVRCLERLDSGTPTVDHALLASLRCESQHFPEEMDVSVPLFGERAARGC
jgi:hypothetical protein